MDSLYFVGGCAPNFSSVAGLRPFILSKIFLQDYTAMVSICILPRGAAPPKGRFTPFIHLNTKFPFSSFIGVETFFGGRLYWIQVDDFFNVFVYCRDLIVMVHLHVKFHLSSSNAVQNEYLGGHFEFKMAIFANSYNTFVNYSF